MTQFKQLQTSSLKYFFQRKPMTQETQEGDYKDYMNSVWQYAMRYLQAGWSVIPLRISDKMPAIEWKKYQTQHPTEDEVTGWFEDGVPNGNGGLTKIFGIAVVTGEISGIVVCDCDNQEALTYAISECSLFGLLTVSTTRGQHIYFKHPGGKVQNKVGGTGRDWPDVAGLDLRGDGGYVVAPPSIKFDDEGKYKHSYTFNCPEHEIENFMATLPVWPGIRVRAKPVPIDEWSFETLSLAAVRTYGEDVWTQVGERVKNLGHLLREGDGRNNWLVKYVGEIVSSGMDESQARVAMDQFQSEFFSPHLPPTESDSVLKSVLLTDRRNHPEKYAAKEAYDTKNEVRKGRAEAIKMIRPNNLAQLRSMSAGKQFLIDPFVPPRAIIQVVGFNGHGKSLWLINMLWAAAKGQSFGSAYADEKVRCLYLDFEGSSTTLIERIDRCIQMHGDMDESFSIWNANVAEEDMYLTDGEGISKLGELINEVNPQLVVIDTVRQAWSGMEENSPHSWVKVNAIAMHMRNSGMSVIVVHHRNKPNMQGHGREAGSTAQLKDLDVQIIVTKVVESLEQAKREAALPDSSTSVLDASGASSTAWTYLRRTLSTDQKLKMVFEISFGKLRQATDNHVPTFVGIAEDTKTGVWTTVASATPMQKAKALASRGDSIEQIVEKLGVSQPTVTKWLTKKGV
jgi:hypothetical protein